MLANCANPLCPRRYVVLLKESCCGWKLSRHSACQKPAKWRRLADSS
jgi:hypothetical protein